AAGGICQGAGKQGYRRKIGARSKARSRGGAKKRAAARAPLAARGSDALAREGALRKQGGPAQSAPGKDFSSWARTATSAFSLFITAWSGAATSPICFTCS